MFLLKAVVVAATFLKPLLLSWMLTRIQQTSQPSAEPYLLALFLAAAATVQAVLVHFFFW